MSSTRPPGQICDDLTRQLAFLASLAGAQQDPRQQPLFEELARVLTRTIVRSRGSRKGLRQATRILADAAVTLERYLRRTAGPGSSYAPAVIHFIRYTMEHCLGLPRPAEARMRAAYQGLLRALEGEARADATRDTYERLVSLYRLRPAWAVALRLSWPFL